MTTTTGSIVSSSIPATSEIKFGKNNNNNNTNTKSTAVPEEVENEGDAMAYHQYASMAVDLSNGHLTTFQNNDTSSSNDNEQHVFTVIRSVRDIDENRRRKYLYTIPFTSTTGSRSTTTTTTISSSSSSSSLTGDQLQQQQHQQQQQQQRRSFVVPPHELASEIVLRLPSPSGKYVAVFRTNGDGSSSSIDTSKVTATILEIWEEYGMSLVRRIDLSSSSTNQELQQQPHGSVVCDVNGGFGIPCWNHGTSIEESYIVYVAEQQLPQTKSFFDAKSVPKKLNNHHNNVVTGGQNVMGIGQYEHYGEKYRNHVPNHGIYIVHVHTGKVGKVNNVPGENHNSDDDDDDDDDSHKGTTITLGQPMVCPPYTTKISNNNNNGHENLEVEESIVYTGWGTSSNNKNSNNNKRLGLIYCQQRPCQLYHSIITKLVHQLSKIDFSNTNNTDDDDDDNATTNTKTCDPPYILLTKDMKLSHSPRFTPAPPSIDDSTPNDSSSSRNASLVFVTSRNGFDTHSGCFAIGTMPLSSIFELYNDTSDSANDVSTTTASSATTIVVDEVWDPTTDSSSSNLTENKHSGSVAGLHFPGFFLQQLPQPSCFLSSEYMLATTQWGSCSKVVRVSILTGLVHLVAMKHHHLYHPYSSDEVLYCNHHGAVISTKTPTQPTVVHFVTIDQLLIVSINNNDSDKNTDHGRQQSSLDVSSTIIGTFSPIASSKIASTATSKCNKIMTTTTTSSSSFDFEIRVIPAPNVDGVSCNHNIQSILLLPKNNAMSDQKSSATSSSSANSLPPLIVIPHGGPHSASTTNFVVSYAYLCGYGRYAILLVNYRGSTGYGQASIQSLPTHIGTLDVQDVIAATNDVCSAELVDASRIGICGGSHGGFITAHLTGQYPTMFKAAVMRNPVVNLPSMVNSTDIPDWCYVEACGIYNFDTYRPPTLEEIEIFYKMSPIQYVHNVQTPTLVALGLKDLRVPPSQGMEWYHSLRSRDHTVTQSAPPPTKLLLYANDDHAIDGVASEADHWVHIKQWFDQYLQ